MNRIVNMTFVTTLLASLAAFPAVAGEVRYLSNAGDDAADGRTPATAWRTVEKLNASLPAGGTARLRCGDTFYGAMRLPAGPDAAHPTVLTSWGEGSKPTLSCTKNLKADPAIWQDASHDFWRVALTNAANYTGIDSPDFNPGFLLVDGAVKPWKRFDHSDLVTEWDFCGEGGWLYVHATQNPATLAKDIRVALNVHAVKLLSHTVVSNIAVRATGAHGLYAGWCYDTPVEDLLIADCDFENIGGSELPNFSAHHGHNMRIRYGNGVEFGSNVRNATVERCTFRGVYDTAFTMQGTPSLTSWSDVHVRHCRMEDCTQAFEIWCKGAPKGRGFERCTFTDNVTRRVGGGWGMLTRPMRGCATPLLIYFMQTDTVDIDVSGNVFEDFPRGPLYRSGFRSDLPLADRLPKGCRFHDNVVAETGPVVARVVARPDRPDCWYAAGETARVSFEVVATNGVRLTHGRVKVTVDNFGTRSLAPERTVDLSVENPVTVIARRTTPGFARVTLSNVTTNDFRLVGNYSWGANTPAFTYGLAYDIGRIASGTPDVDDFDAFWSNAVARLEATVPVDARVEPGVSADPAFSVSRISVATAQGRRVWGWLTEPKDLSKGPYPVHVEVSGAGIGYSVAHPGKAGVVCCRMNVHTYPQPEGTGEAAAAERMRLYREQDAKYSKPHGGETYYFAGIHEGRESYFYYAVILGLNRTVDWLATRPECDARRITYGGTSQGGGMGLALAYLNRHIARAAIYVPAVTDLLGYRAEEGRQSGWPQLVENQRPENRAAAETNAPYFCGVNFARRIRKPVRFVVGFSDLTCAPNAGCAAYNACPSADKGLLCGVAMGHRPYDACYDWLEAWEADPSSALAIPETVQPPEWDVK